MSPKTTDSTTTQSLHKTLHTLSLDFSMCRGLPFSALSSMYPKCNP